MQNVGQSENRNIDKVNVQLDVVKSSTPQSSASSPAKSETETYSGAPAKYMTDSSESEDDSVSEVKRVLFSAEAVAVRKCAICTAPNTARDIFSERTTSPLSVRRCSSIRCWKSCTARCKGPIYFPFSIQCKLLAKYSVKRQKVLSTYLLLSNA